MKLSFILTLFLISGPARAGTTYRLENHENFETLRNKGKVMIVSYNKKADIMTVIYEGETLRLEPITAASGCAYGNQDFRYINL